jgi:hypothetical protein
MCLQVSCLSELLQTFEKGAGQSAVLPSRALSFIQAYKFSVNSRCNTVRNAGLLIASAVFLNFRRIFATSF